MKKPSLLTAAFACGLFPTPALFTKISPILSVSVLAGFCLKDTQQHAIKEEA